MKADGSDQKRLTTEPGYDGGTFFTKDGRIVWRHFEENGLIANVWTMKPDGTDKKQITDFGSMSWAPYEHPSGEYFLFASNKLGFENFEVFMVDKAGLKEPVRITYSAGFDGLPVPSPDGTQIAFTSSRAGGAGAAGQIYLAQWNHRAAMAALKAAGLAQTPAQEINTRRTRRTRRFFYVACVTILHARDRAGALSLLPRHSAQTATPSRTRAHVETLASPKMEGRLTGSAGREAGGGLSDRRAEEDGGAAVAGHDRLPHAVHVHGRLEGRRHARSRSRKRARPMAAGISPAAPASRRSRSPTAARCPATSSLRATALSFPTRRISATTVTRGFDVKDKIVVVLRYFPEDADQKTRGILARYADLRYKAQAARQRGAKGMVVVTGPRSPNAGGVVPMSFDTAIAGSGIVAASISGDAAAPIFAAAGKQLEAVQKELDSGNPHVAGFAIPNLHHHDRREDHSRAADREQRGRLFAGDDGDHRREQAVDRGGRAFRSPRPRRRRQFARRQERGQRDSSRRRRQRVRHGCGAGHRRGIQQAAAQAQPAARVLVGRGARPARIECVRHQTAGADRSDRRLPELRHGRPGQRQQADGAGHRHQRHVAEAARAGQRRGRIRSHAAGGSVSADRRQQLQQRQRAVADVFHRRAHRVPQTRRHGRQDQLRGSRSRRPAGDRDRAAPDGQQRRAAVHQGRPEDGRAAAAPACACSPARSPTTRPT